MKQLCIVTGVGSATGRSIVKKFVSEGYEVAMLARNQNRLDAIAREFESAHAFPVDLMDIQKFQETLDKIVSVFGTPKVVIHNAVSSTFDTFLEADPEDLERNFRVNTTAFMYLARHVAPAMIEAGGGAIIATGNTASLRGVPTYALFAPTKAAQRIFAQAIAKELGPQGIHVGYLSIDAAIDSDWLGPESERPSWLRIPDDWQGKREDYFAHPDAIATEIHHLAHQDKSTWAFEMTIRPFAEKW